MTVATTLQGGPPSIGVPITVQIRKNSFFRYIQNKISQYAISIAAPCISGRNARPEKSNACAPKFVLKEDVTKSGNKCAIK